MQTFDVEIHACLHMMAESLISIDELGTAAKLADLLGQGLDRHEAVHAIGTTYNDVYLAMHQANSGEPDQADVDRIAAPTIAALSAQSWSRRREAEPNPGEAPSWIHELAYCLGEIEPELRARILAMGASAVDPLVAAVEEELDTRYEPGARARQAVLLLGDFRDPRAIDLLIRIVEGSGRFGLLTVYAYAGLMAMHTMIVEPGLARLDAAQTDKHRCDWSTLLSVCGAVDDRIYVRLERGLVDHPAAAARWLADYGDPRALPSLRATLMSARLAGEPQREAAVGQLVAAIEQLGGELTDDERRVVDRHLAEARWFARPPGKA